MKLIGKIQLHDPNPVDGSPYAWRLGAVSYNIPIFLGSRSCLSPKKFKRFYRNFFIPMEILK